MKRYQAGGVEVILLTEGAVWQGVAFSSFRTVTLEDVLDAIQEVLPK